VVQSDSLDSVYQDIASTLHLGTKGYDLLVITAGLIISIQAQLVTSRSITPSIVLRIFLIVGMMSELVGVMLIIYFNRFPVNHSSSSSHVIPRLASGLPTLLVLIGIISLAAALVVEVFDISIGAAAVMSGVLILGVIFCLCAWCFGAERRNVPNDKT